MGASGFRRFVTGVGVALVASASAVVIATPASASTRSDTFLFDSGHSVYDFVVPAGVTHINIVARGAGGGEGNNSYGGWGATVTARGVAVTPGETLKVFPGERGESGSSVGNEESARGGMNGGGDGGFGINLAGAGATISAGGGGGGASDVRRAPYGLADRLVVAGGGGGGGGGSGCSDGGNSGADASFSHAAGCVGDNHAGGLAGNHGGAGGPAVHGVGGGGFDANGATGGKGGNGAIGMSSDLGGTGGGGGGGVVGGGGGGGNGSATSFEGAGGGGGGSSKGGLVQQGDWPHAGQVTISYEPAVPGSPLNVSAVPGDGKATVSFAKPSSDGGSAITGYGVTCGSKGALGTTSPMVVTGLTNAVTVSCTVRAANAVGTGPPSVPVSVTPKKAPSVPGAPVNVSVVAGNKQATVKFAKPASNGGSAITGYSATCGSKTATGTGSPIVVTGLANGVKVNCTAKAKNAVGTGPASSPPVPVTPKA